MKKKINIELLCSLVGIRINRLYSYSDLLTEIELLFNKIANDIKEKKEYPEFEGELNSNLKVFKFKGLLIDSGYSGCAYTINRMPQFMSNILNFHSKELNDIINGYRQAQRV